MTFRPSRRHWVKLWVNEHLDGSLRLDLDREEMSIWVDLLALAGVSRFPGLIAASQEEDGYRGYPLHWIAQRIHADPELVERTLLKCERHGRLLITRTDSQGKRLKRAKPGDWDSASVIRLVNWEKYQSEYQGKKARHDYQQEFPTIAEQTENKPEGTTEEIFCQYFGKLTANARQVIKDLSKEYTEEKTADMLELVGSDPTVPKSLSEVAKRLRAWRTKPPKKP